MTEYVIYNQEQRDKAVAAVRSITAESPRMVVKVDEFKPSRSVQANKYYWGVILETLSEHTGHTPEELHEAFKLKFLYRENLTILGNDVPMYATTTKLKVKEFQEYLEKVVLFSQTELGCYMPAEEYYG